MTINQLTEYCIRQIKKGNGNKNIFITDDDEGNGYHELFYQFTDDIDEIKEIQEFVYITDEKDLDKIVLLG